MWDKKCDKLNVIICLFIGVLLFNFWFHNVTYGYIPKSSLECFIYIQKMDLSLLKINGSIYIRLVNIATNKTRINCKIYNEWNRKYIGLRPIKSKFNFFINKTDEWIENNTIYKIFKCNQTFALKIFGNPEFYPYDYYMLNFTCILDIPYDSINKEDVDITIHLPKNWNIEKIGKTIVKGDNAYVLINRVFIFKHSLFRNIFIEWQYLSFFIMLGVMNFLNVLDFNQKFALYITLFIATIAFYWNILKVIPNVSITLIEVLCFYISYFISVYFIMDVIKYFSIKEKNRFNRIFELIASIINIIIFMMGINIFMNIAKIYKWTMLPKFQIILIVIVNIVPAVLSFINDFRNQ